MGYNPDETSHRQFNVGKQEATTLETREATEDEIADEYKKLSEQYGLTVEQIKEMVKDEDLAEDIKVKKAADFVGEKAVVKDVEHVHHDHDHKHAGTAPAAHPTRVSHPRSHGRWMRSPDSEALPSALRSPCPPMPCRRTRLRSCCRSSRQLHADT